MDNFRKWTLAFLGVFRLAGLGAGGLAVLVGLFQDLSGGSTFWSLTPSNWVNLGLVMVAIFGVATLIRHEYLLHGVSELYGNEHAKKLLSDGIPPYRDEYFRYVRQGDFAIVHRFWLAGRVNLEQSGGVTDLHVACESGHAAIAKGIIERGGDVNRPDEQGRTPLMVASAKGKLKVAEILFEHEPALEARTTTGGVSALYAAAANGHTHMVKLLIKFDAALDSLDHDNMTPLMAAMAQQKWDAARLLMNAGADLGRVDAAGATLRDYASSGGVPTDIIEKLDQAGIARSTLNLIRTGGGHDYTGKVRNTWETEVSREARFKSSEAL